MPKKKNDSAPKKKSALKVKTSYKDSGVDVKAGDDFVDWIHAENSSMPHQKQIVEGIGGFASLFRLDLNKYKKSCIVRCTDGVGTKVKLASQFELYDGIGQDLVAMCVNDLLCTGGDPLFFLDYLAMGKLELKQAKKILKSIRQACIESDLALIGGETAEMPGVYTPPDFDCAGFAVGIVEESKRFGPHRVKLGDRLIALPSSGFHSNGYSLLRKTFKKDLKKYSKELITPTRLYVKIIQKLKAQFEIKALAHITGGGMENIPRVVPTQLGVKLIAYEFPKLFQEVQKRTGLSDLEMLGTLNCGVGMVLIVSPDDHQSVLDFLKMHGEKAWTLGEVALRSDLKNKEWVYES